MRVEYEPAPVGSSMTGKGAKFAGAWTGAPRGVKSGIGWWAAVLVVAAGMGGMPAEAAISDRAASSGGVQARSTFQKAPSNSLLLFAPVRRSPHVVPDQASDEDGVGLAMQLAPMRAGSVIRWHAKMLDRGHAAVASATSRVRVKIERKPGNRPVYLALVIALFTVSLTGVALMWRQVAKPPEPDRPGWERWRH